MKNIVPFLCLIVLGCQSSKKLLIGTYQTNDENRMINYRVELRADSSYTFHNFDDMITVTLQGNWVVKRNKLILNSYIQHDTKGSFKESTISSRDTVTFRLFDIYGNVISNEKHVYIRVKSAHYAVLNKSANIYVLAKEKLPIEFSVGVGSFFKETEVRLKHPESNMIDVYLVPNTKGFFQRKTQFVIQDSTAFKSKTLLFTRIH